MEFLGTLEVTVVRVGAAKPCNPKVIKADPTLPK